MADSDKIQHDHVAPKCRCSVSTPEHVVIMDNDVIDEGDMPNDASMSPERLSVADNDVTGSTEGFTESPNPLYHVDIWPQRLTKGSRVCDCAFETFDVLIDRANKWMRQNEGFELINCETVEKKVLYIKDIYDCSVSYVDPEGPTPACIIKGLRLWYRQTIHCDMIDRPGELRYIDVLPYCTHASDKHPKYETLGHTVYRINQRLMEEPLDGRIIGIETIRLKVPQEDWKSDICIEPEQTMWFDEYNVHLLSFIRLFYRKQETVLEQIGFEDFAPDAVDPGSLFHPAKYSSFSSLLKRATNWINKSTDKTVLNIKTLDAKHRKTLESKACRFKTEAMFESRIETRFRAFFIRIAYTYRPTVPSQYTLTRPPRLTCRTFVPMQLQRGYENMEDMLERIWEDIKAIHAHILFVETVAIPEWIMDPTLLECGERTFYDGEWYFVPDNDGNDKGPYRYALLYVVRVYFDCPPLYTELQHRISAYKIHHGCCAIL